MFGWLALKSATTLSSTVFCSGASPPPRQQYQRISTGRPARRCVAGPLAAMVGGAARRRRSTGRAARSMPPQALATSAAMARIVPERVSRGAMQLLLLGPWLGQPDVAPAVGRRRYGSVAGGRSGPVAPVAAAAG